MKPFYLVALLHSVVVGAVSLSAATAAKPSRPPQEKPNLILILADDLGYETIGANGGTSYATPTLDRLASNGVRFTHAYAQPLCTPTRVQLMTGKYNVRNYVRFDFLDPRETTFANRLKAAGYATAMVGKWQLGQGAALPGKFGFDESCLWQLTRRPPRYANPGLEYNGVEKDFTQGEYGPDLVNDYAMDFVARRKDGPFLLYYSMMLTHDPYQPTPDSATWDPKAIGEGVNHDPRHFGEMVTYMDKLIGKLVARLDELGLRENTLILFVGDNGTGRNATSVMAGKTIRGGKSTTTEYGMHVPLIASWPGGIGAGKVCNDLVDTTDFLPTLLEAAAVAVPKGEVLDGRSFLPQLRGETGRPREWIYSWYSRRQTPDFSFDVRECAFDHRFKLYRSGEFFDLQADIEEQHSLAVSTLRGDAMTAATRLQTALDRYATVRPSEMDRMLEEYVKLLPPNKQGKKRKAK